jgi:hypothetical protein
MPLLVYSYPPFTPNTVILSARVNAKYDDIKTLLNTTKLDDANIQDAGITRATKLKAGTADHVLINAGSGVMSSEAQLAITRGGTGLNIVLSVSDADKVIKVNSSGTALEVAAVPESAGTRFYMYNRFY